MVVYRNTKKNFIEQCQADANGSTIGNAIANAMDRTGIAGFDAIQKQAWCNSLPPLAEILNKSAIPDDVVVAAEYTIRLTKERLDFVITGKNGIGQRTLLSLSRNNGHQ